MSVINKSIGWCNVIVLDSSFFDLNYTVYIYIYIYIYILFTLFCLLYSKDIYFHFIFIFSSVLFFLPTGSWFFNFPYLALSTKLNQNGYPV